MVDVTSAASASARGQRATQQFGRIVVVGGGCYGSYYVRQLHRAMRAEAVRWRSLVVVDRDPDCAVATMRESDRPPGLSIAVSDWHAYFGRFLSDAAAAPSANEDAIVPSPLMPHLMADWLVARARARWPDRTVTSAPLSGAPQVPWQRAGEDGTHYVSFAEWICPINCIEPARCPETRGARDWSMPVAVRGYADAERSAGRAIEPPLVFHCTHRAYGVGMIDVAAVVAADSAVADRGARAAARFLIGTVSHCHGALRQLDVGS